MLKAIFGKKGKTPANLTDIKRILGIKPENEYGLDVLCEIALSSKKPNIVKDLIELGLDVNQPLKSGSSFLIMACNLGLPNIVEMLVNNGADIDKILLPNNKTPLDIALDSESGNALNRQSRIAEIVTILVSHGAKSERLQDPKWAKAAAEGQMILAQRKACFKASCEDILPEEVGHIVKQYSGWERETEQKQSSPPPPPSPRNRAGSTGLQSRDAKIVQRS